MDFYNKVRLVHCNQINFVTLENTYQFKEEEGAFETNSVSINNYIVSVIFVMAGTTHNGGFIHFLLSVSAGGSA